MLRYHIVEAAVLLVRAEQLNTQCWHFDWRLSEIYHFIWRLSAIVFIAWLSVVHREQFGIEMLFLITGYPLFLQLYLAVIRHSFIVRRSTMSHLKSNVISNCSSWFVVIRFFKHLYLAVIRHFFIVWLSAMSHLLSNLILNCGAFICGNPQFYPCREPMWCIELHWEASFTWWEGIDVECKMNVSQMFTESKATWRPKKLSWRRWSVRWNNWGAFHQSVTSCTFLR